MDIAKLRPRSLPAGAHFETKSDARKLIGRYAQALRRRGLKRDLRRAKELSACRRQNDVHCRLPSCPLCARKYRRWLFSQGFPLAQKNVGKGKILTIYLAEFPLGQLHRADVSKLHSMLRARLRRAGFTGAVIVGGTEVQYRARDQSWLVHVHLLAVDASEQAIAKLRKTFETTKYAFVAQELRDPIEQVSYLQKFSTFHRPGKHVSGSRARAYPLPKKPLLEVLHWLSKRRFDELQFLFGARRRGLHIVREAKRGSAL